MLKATYYLICILTIFTLSAAETYPINKILSLEISSSINPATLNYLKEGYKKAQETPCDLVLIKLNTPGGLVSTTKEILTLIGSQDIPTAVWVTPQGASATSAGAIIASGAHLLFMSDGTNIGAATPIELSGDIAQKDLKSKAVNDLVALVQSLAESHGRNGKLFGEMVEHAKSYKTIEAKEQKLISEIVNTPAELIRAVNNQIISIKGKKILLASNSTTEIITFAMDLGQKILDIFAHPSMAYILFVIGAALIYLEMQAAGGFIAGSIGVICLIMAGISFQVLPLNLGALLLIISSFILFVLESYITSYGILSLAGIATLILGSLFLFRTNDAYIAVSSSVIIATVASITLFVLLVGYLFVKDIFKKRVQNLFSLQGKTVTIVEILESNIPGQYLYQVKVSGELWKAQSSKQLQLNDTAMIESQKDMMLIIY